MNQQINLYLSEFKVKRDQLTALVMLQLLVGVVAVLVLLSAYNAFTGWQLNGELADLRVTLVEESKKTSELDEVLARRSENTELADRLQQAEVRLDSRRQIRDFLSETKLGNVIGFSEYFKDLSRASIDGLSITDFSFSEGGAVVSIAGLVIDSAMVPRYVGNIEGGSSPLRTQHFNPSISRADVDSPYFSFQLRTSRE